MKKRFLRLIRKFWKKLLGGGILVAFATAWIQGAVPIGWSLERVTVCIESTWPDKSPSPGGGFLIVLSWFENDYHGQNGKLVERAFRGVDGITLRRSCAKVKASGAKNEWQPAMQEGARAVLDDWQGDLALVGEVTQSHETLGLWFVPRLGKGTLDRGDMPYTLRNASLGADFHEHLRAQITAVALAAVAPLADTEARGHVLDKGLREAIEKLSVLLERPPIDRPDHLSALHQASAVALQALSEREGGTAHLGACAVGKLTTICSSRRSFVTTTYGV